MRSLRNVLFCSFKNKHCYFSTFERFWKCKSPRTSVRRMFNMNVENIALTFIVEDINKNKQRFLACIPKTSSIFFESKWFFVEFIIIIKLWVCSNSLWVEGWEQSNKSVFITWLLRVMVRCRMGYNSVVQLLKCFQKL